MLIGDTMIEQRGTCKLLRMESIKNSNDIISGLPDSLLHHIMSFLKTREAVQTCILAKRWKKLWRTLPYLHLNLNDFRIAKINASSSQLFINFVSNLLLFRDPTGLHTFELDSQFPLNCHYQIISGWVLYVLRCNPRVLFMRVPKGAALQICLSVFKCMSLEDLLFGCFDKADQINLVPRTITLPHLRRLHLDTMRLDEDFMEKMFSGCPHLTYLHLAWCHLKIRSIRSQKLNCLSLNRCVYELEMQLIDASSLTELCINGLEALTHRINITSMPSLLKGVVGYWSSQPMQGFIFPCFSNVQQLELKGCAIEALLKTELPRCPIFHNLRSLYIEQKCTSDFALMANLVLQHCPKLEDLVLSHGVDYCCECGTNYDIGFERRRKKLSLLGPMPFEIKTITVLYCCCKVRQTLETLKKRGIRKGIAFYKWGDD